MSAWLLVLGTLGALLPIVIAVVIVVVRIRTLPAREQTTAKHQAARFGVGVLGGIVGGTLISATVVALILLLRWLTQR